MVAQKERMRENTLFDPALLDESPTQIASFKRAVMETEAWMVFPDDMEKRKAVIPILTDSLLTRLRALPERQNQSQDFTHWKPLLDDCEQRALESGGYKNAEELRVSLGKQLVGNERLLLEVGKDERRKRERAVCAYLITEFIRLDVFGKFPPNSHKRRDPSLALAMHLLRSDTYSGTDVFADEVSINQAWERNSKIAHLCAARYSIGNAKGWNDLYSPQHFICIMGVAHYLRKTMLAMINPHKAQGNNKQLFSEKSFIAIPDHASIPKVENIPFQPFTEDEWKILDGYKTPRRGNRSKS